MKLELVRCRESEYGTFGRLFIDDEFFCYTLEPCSDSEYPCIPIGQYPLSLSTVSPKYRFRQPYNLLCKGKVPRLLYVPGREGILIHIGCFLKDTKGCILLGYRSSLTRIFDSTRAFTDFYHKIIGIPYLKIIISDVRK